MQRIKMDEVFGDFIQMSICLRGQSGFWAGVPFKSTWNLSWVSKAEFTSYPKFHIPTLFELGKKVPKMGKHPTSEVIRSMCIISSRLRNVKFRYA